MRTRRINDHGIGLAGAEGEKLRDLRIDEEGEMVQIWVEVPPGCTEALQYLSPEEAIAIGNAMILNGRRALAAEMSRRKK